jgi:RNA polymerase sigma factor (TIGR02999 family)
MSNRTETSGDYQRPFGVILAAPTMAQVSRSPEPHGTRLKPTRFILPGARPDDGVERSGTHRDLIRHRRPHRDVRPVPVTSRKDFAINPPRATPDDAVDVTELLADLRAGRREAFDQILPLVYNELRRTARRELGVRPSDTLSSTALVHELYLKFSRSRADWRDRAHFLGVAAVAMRHILVDRARRRTADKRGGNHRHVTLADDLTTADSQAESLLELHEALDQLTILDERLARVVECRFFGGMTEQETAEALQVTARTVRRDWVKARGLLFQALQAHAPRDLPRVSSAAVR